jgi:hypothetical protein
MVQEKADASVDVMSDETVLNADAQADGRNNAQNNARGGYLEDRENVRFVQFAVAQSVMQPISFAHLHHPAQLKEISYNYA